MTDTERAIVQAQGKALALLVLSLKNAGRPPPIRFAGELAICAAATRAKLEDAGKDPLEAAILAEWASICQDADATLRGFAPGVPH